jgi:hypothetical protein
MFSDEGADRLGQAGGMTRRVPLTGGEKENGAVGDHAP